LGFRTLDGKPWHEETDFLTEGYFPAPHEPAGIVETPLRWNEGYGRIVSATDGKFPPTQWYLVRNDERTGDVYAAGFDGFSKMPIGYIGRNGFSTTKPLPDEQFHVPTNGPQESFFWLILSDQTFEHKRLASQDEISDQSPGEWTAFLIATDHLWEIDLRKRSVRPVADFSDASSISEMVVARATFEKLPNYKPVDAAEMRRHISSTPEEKSPYVGLMAVRERDRLVVFNLKVGKRESFNLPEKLRDRRFSATLVGPDQLLIYAYEQGDEYWSGGPITHVYWTNRAGQIQREKEVLLAAWRPPTPRVRAWSASALVPVPLVWLIGGALGAPLYLVQINFLSDLGSAVAFVAGVAWPPLIVVLVVAAVVTWLTLRSQWKYRRRGTAAWTVFVFLFGLPGFLAYLVENRRAKLEACLQCGAIVPRDREACADCNTEFAPPVRIGTEIFA
jgi:hypothetical protein